MRLLQVDTGETTVTVEVPPEAVVEIAHIPGGNDVNQLKQHLEVQRMSKSKGNVVNPDDLVDEYGADTVRAYLMFAFEWLKGGPWDNHNIIGCRRFIEDMWRIGTLDYSPTAPSDDAGIGLRRRIHQSIQKVDSEMMAFKWNTAVAALMTLRNDMLDASRNKAVSVDVWNEGVETMIKLLAPISPHITEQLWRDRGNQSSIHLQAWPEADADAAREDTITMIVQVNGKVRDRIDVAADINATDAEAAAFASGKVSEWTSGNEIRKVIVREPKLVNIVI